MEDPFQEFIQHLTNCTLFQDELVQWEFRDEISSTFYCWFVSNCEYFKEIATNADNIQGQAVASSCFNNSQNISLKNEGIKYYEGIMHGAKFQSNTHHGFNIIDNKILDITFIKFPQNFDSLRDKIFYYCGVHIPNDFIAKHTTIKEETQHCPLLYDFFLSQEIKSLTK